MNQDVVLKVKEKFVAQYRKGYPLLVKEAFQDLSALKEEGQLVTLVDSKGNFICKGYYGKQNKGYGWVLTPQQSEPIDQAFFTKQLAKAFAFRAPFFKNTETTAFRIFNGEGDGVGGLTIDYFDGFLLVNWYSLGIYQFKEVILQALNTVTEFKGIYEKKRFDTKGQYIEDDDFVAGERATFPLVIKENGVQFAVYLNEGAMVGIFLDQRDVRKRLREAYSDDKTVLNTFSYTGAFSVFAALGGATQTTSVDLANRSRKKTEEQFLLNGVHLDAQVILVEDVFNYFKYAGRKGLTFDTVVLDPPSFARSKKVTFSAEKNYTGLLKEAIALTKKGGTILASTNASSFNMKKFKQFIDQAFKDSQHKYKLQETYSLPEDFKTTANFPEGDYLKVCFIQKLT
ncbi:MAG TPA: class I SAM-dependent rRNA methyltransferase [Candidatus Angelobacter sp.]|nr:class I SAM-dependent rRNA methyltransferase [Candidatus Angelobacter sp.]